MAKIHPALVWSGRTILGIVGVAAAGAVVLGIGRVPLPTIGADPQSMVVNPVISEQLRSCPGGLLVPSATNSQAVTGGDPTITIAASGTPTTSTLQTPNNTGGAGHPIAVAVPATGSTIPSLSVASGQGSDRAELRGFAAVGCAAPSSDSWLVGGSTATGRSAFIILTNPGKAVANVDLRIYADTGVIDAPGATGLIVSPGEQRIISLASLAPGQIQPIVHVSARGGSVSAVIQQSKIIGLDAKGVDYISASAPPSTDQTITGLVIPTAAAPLEHDHDYDDASPSLRFIAPGKDPVPVTVRFIPEEGSPEPLPVTFTLPPGIVQELPLANVPGGKYTVVLDSDAAIVAGARVTSSSGADFAWFASSLPVGADGALAIATGDAPTLHLRNAGDSEAAVTLTAADGKKLSTVVPSGATATLPVSAKTTYTTSGMSSVTASVSYGGESAFSSYVITPTNPSAEPVTVYPR